MKMRFILNRCQTRISIKSFLLIVYGGVLAIVIISYFAFQEDSHQDNKPEGNQAVLDKPPDEFACHYLKDKDALPPLDKSITFPLNSIFFIESSCKGLTSRQACSVESAARANPDRQVNVLFTSPITWDMFKNSAISKLLTIVNVEAARIHLEDYAEETPLEAKFKKVPLTRDDLNMDLSNILKYLTIYKYSGTYLALDVIVARSFKDLNNNWVVKETPASISSDIFTFSANQNGRAIADMVMNVIISDLNIPQRQDLWSFDSPVTMKKLLHLWCGTADMLYLVSSMCKDLQVLEPDHFFPISFSDRQKYFKQGEWEKWKEQKIYTYQIWDRFTKYHAVPKGSLLQNIAKEYCPLIYHFYGDKFGTW